MTSQTEGAGPVGRVVERVGGGVDLVTTLDKRLEAALDSLERLEEAVFNIEKATVNLDRAFEGGMEMLPDFMARRLKGEGRRKPPTPTSEQPNE